MEKMSVLRAHFSFDTFRGFARKVAFFILRIPTAIGSKGCRGPPVNLTFSDLRLIGGIKNG
jgi:hypothetical protein